MLILGLSFFYHDSAAVLLHDGLIMAAAEEERFSRVKHDFDFPTRAITFCLEQAGITANDLDYVVFYEKPMLKFERILFSTLGSFPKSWRTFGEAMVNWFDQKLWIKSLLMEKIGVPAEKVLFVGHHMSHAASAFFASPYEDAAILTVDGVGEWTTASLGYGQASWEDGNNTIKLTHEQRFPHSLGLLYSAFTAFLGFRINNGEYKVMGMSPYGEPRFVDKIERIFKVYDDGSFWIDMDYFSYHYSAERTFNDKFIKLFGLPRVHESEFFTPKTNPEVDPKSAKAVENQYYADIAASIQLVTEETILKMANAVYRQTGTKRLCMAGGVALNSKANGRLLRETPFEQIFIQPAPGDDGGALGAALYTYHVLLGQPRRFTHEHNFWGASFEENEILEAVRASGYSYECVNDEIIAQRAVEDILDGKVISLYQGRAEWGPRALGNRSILADPRRADMKEIVNSKIKFREPFRPFAPVILEEATERFFPQIRDATNSYPLRYMLVVYPWDETLGQRVPAVNHLGTGRLQTIREEWNPRYYRMVEMFGEQTGIPVLMNTSFNLRGEPIVNSPANALNTFSNSGIDSLYIENYIVRKST